MNEDLNTPGVENHPPAEAAFFCEAAQNIAWVYGAGRRARLETMTRCFEAVVTTQNFDAHAARLSEVEAVFSTWGMPILSESQIERMPRLRVVFFAAGSVQSFARPYLAKGISVVSAAAANAVPVAEFTVAQILLANKGYFRNVREARAGDGTTEAFVGEGNFETTVGLLGAGQIGRKVIELLRPFALRVIVFDPFLPAERARELGVIKVSLEDAFRQSAVVSNHLANLPATVGMLKGAHFESMRADATFVNTARAATVAEDELFDVLRKRPDLTALLDVTASKLGFPSARDLPNVRVSTHIAGSQKGEVVRMADCVIEEYQVWRRGEPLRHGVSLQMLETMA